jgi:predicted nucleotide-binding protein (sugar kinase/HSP70/actin superfamily)
VAIYSEIINNIDTLIKEVNTSTTISKLQKRKLLAQYRLYKSRTQLALKREQKNTIVNIDFQRIIPNKTTNSNTTTSINTGNTNSTVTYQQPSQPYQQNTTTNTNISTPISTTNTSIQTVNPTTINTTSQTQNTIPSTPTYNEKILI